MSTNNLRGFLTRKLLETGLDVYYEEASTNATFPYITYALDKQRVSYLKSIYTIEVNIWNNNIDKTFIEDIADAIEENFEDVAYMDDGGLLAFHANDRGYIDDPNKDLKRLMLKIDMGRFI